MVHQSAVELGQYWVLWLFVDWWRQAITWTNIDLSSRGKLNGKYQDINHYYMCCIIAYSELQTHLPWTTELIYIYIYKYIYTRFLAFGLLIDTVYTHWSVVLHLFQSSVTKCDYIDAIVCMARLVIDSSTVSLHSLSAREYLSLWLCLGKSVVPRK